MSSGKKQLLLFAVAGAMFTALMLAGVVGNVVRGNYMAVPLVGSALLLAVAVIWFGIWLNQRRIQMMFRHPTPDRLIENYHATLLHARARKIPNAEAVAAYLSALAATVYGQFDRAREELDVVDWRKAPPMYQGHRLHLLALVALLEKRDPTAARRLAAEARELEKADAAGGLPVLDGAIRVATGEGDEETMGRTRRAAGRGVGAMPAVCAWALSLHLESAGQPAEAGRYRDRARDAAPYFVGLGVAK